MLSRTLKRALLDTPSTLPPTFLLPWTATLTTSATTSPASSQTPPPPSHLPIRHAQSPRTQPSPTKEANKTRRQSSSVKSAKRKNDPLGQLPPPVEGEISSSVRELLPLMHSQGPHYITVHIHGNPYLVTEGDTIRLPFLMAGVEPGDTIRLNKAINLGSRDFTLKASAAAPKMRSPTMTTTEVLDPTTGKLPSHSRVMPKGPLASTHSSVEVPHYVPHLAKGKHSYLDERLFVCRAVIMGVESEPMRIKEKTKRRQRHVRRVKSKHRFTILKIKELRLKTLEELDSPRK